MLPEKIAFVDVETTGRRSFYDRIIEIGIVRVENNEIVSTYNKLLNPGTFLPPEIVRLTGITSAVLENAPTFYQCKDEIAEILKDAVFVAHNVRFDYGFLRQEFARENMTFSSKHFCTVKLSRFLFPKQIHHNLDAVIERCGLTCGSRHRAFDDAKVLFDFYNHARKKLGDKKVIEAITNASKKPSLPQKLNHQTIDELPEQPGVYLFFGENNSPLYIGKSVNIRNRVLSHFSSDLRSPLEMKISQQIERIETIITGGELGALLKESQLIKDRMPLYNRKLRLKSELIGLHVALTPEGYQTVSITPITKITMGEQDNFLGFFRSRKQAKDFLAEIVKEYSLCDKLLGLENGSGACFGHRLEKCKGACIGKESFLRYNLRFLTAFSKMKIMHWPFKGPVIITEENTLSGVRDSFLIDNWCYRGSVRSDWIEAIKETDKNDILFDLDVYKILKQYILRPQNQKNIKVLTQPFSNYLAPSA